MDKTNNTRGNRHVPGNTRHQRMRDRRWKRKRRRWMLRQISMWLIVFFIISTMIYLVRYNRSKKKNTAESGTELQEGNTGSGISSEKESGAVPDTFSPHAVEETRPDKMIISTEIMDNGEILSDSSFEPWYQMDFKSGADYTDAEGIVTFRGNSFRDSPAFGYADMEKHSILNKWEVPTDSLGYNGKAWTGSGWTGQPLMMRWPRDVKAHMNMYDWAKDDDDLVEVIYACLDGRVYFMDLKSGKATRETLNLGYTFKGSGALDPRGYPVLYLGAGYNSKNGRSRAFIISLLDGSVLYTFGNEDPFADRSVSFFDSSPLVDAGSDTLIYPGENGLLYLIHLNTHYDEEDGTLSVDPDRTVKWKYRGRRSGDEFWLGMEDSAAVYGGYLFIADNGGHLMCLDLNTLKLVWVQDTLDDSNSTPVLSVEDGRLYLYISTSFHLGWRSSGTAVIPVWKIDAETGEIIWQKDYECQSREGVSGGVESTIALGKNDLDDYLYVTVSMTDDRNSGVLACLKKETGEVAWEHSAAYAWSSPVCVYDKKGMGNVLYCSSDGKMYLLDGSSGKEHFTYDIGQTTIEASPAVYNDYVVIGTRDCRICGFKLE